MHIDNGTYNYAMSILKSNNGNPDSCNRYPLLLIFDFLKNLWSLLIFIYNSCLVFSGFNVNVTYKVAGEAHFIHTYMGDGNPLPSFEGEPKLVGLEGDIDTFTSLVWGFLMPAQTSAVYPSTHKSCLSDPHW